MRTILLSCCVVCCVSLASAQQTVVEVSAPLAVLSDDDSHVTQASFRRIDTQQQWSQVWLEHLDIEPVYDNPNRESFQVDFKRCMVVAIFGGATTNTAGYRVDTVTNEVNTVVLRFEARTYQTAGPNGGAAHVTPYAFVVLPKTTKNIVLERSAERYKGQPPVWRKVAELPAATVTPNAQRSSLAHPKRVDIPDDIPFVLVRNAREKDGTVYKQRLHAAFSYESAHHQAWEDCLEWIASPYRKSGAFRAPIPQTNDPYLLRGLEDGSNDCMARIQALREAGHTDESIRQLAQQTLQQSGVYSSAPPPPPAN
ncbi:hypothetical protein [Aeoliella sp.]|uniref:hypothetical protein n=1 Tax=Aeoliella sp. TaxID=2795800 RepID=UPI003CCB899F